MVHNNLIHYGTKAERDSHIHTLAKTNTTDTLWNQYPHSGGHVDAVSADRGLQQSLHLLPSTTACFTYTTSQGESLITPLSPSLVLLSNSATLLSFHHLLAQSQTVPCSSPPPLFTQPASLCLTWDKCNRLKSQTDKETYVSVSGMDTDSQRPTRSEREKWVQPAVFRSELERKYSVLDVNLKLYHEVPLKRLSIYDCEFSPQCRLKNQLNRN